MILRCCVALALLVGACGPALAGDDDWASLPFLSDDRPFDWTGAFIGISVTRNWGHLDTNGTDTALDNNNSGATLVGGFGGVRWESPWGVVLGALIEAPFHGFDGGAQDTEFFPLPAFDPPVQYEFDVNYIVLVSGQIGYAFGAVLPYFEFGYGRTEVDYKVLNVNQSNNYTPGAVQKTTKVHDVIKVGGGVDVAVLHNLIFGLEFSYLTAARESYDVPWLLPGPNNIGADAFSAGGSISVKFP